MSKPVLAIAEQRNGAFRKATYEVVSEGRRLADQLGGELFVILLGSGINGLSNELAHYGADKVLVGDNEIFKNYSSEGYTKTIVEAVKNVDPESSFFVIRVLNDAEAMSKSWIEFSLINV